jgi:two-component system, chemotaxis family, CheB/CheR fusion protein
MDRDDNGLLPPRWVTPVCAIGASAGGVAALQRFFEAIRDDLGLAYVVIMHLSPNHPSQLSEILRLRTRMPVEQVDTTARLRPDRVFVIPPDQELVIDGDEVTARPFSEPRGHRAPIDMFFRSVAAGRGDGLSVVLTGAGSDGAMGVRAAKEAGGVVFVQDPHDAEYPMMPRSAIATGVADFVAGIPEIAERIAEVMHSKAAVRNLTEEAASADLRRILGFLRARSGHDFADYKRATVMRRVLRRMQVTRRETLAAYADYLADNPEEAQELFGDLLISVTRFFRDADAFETLARAAIGPILEEGEEDRPVRVWVVGCATGEEAYSVAILLLEAAQRLKTHPPPIQIFASDLDEGALATGREGLYPRAIEADVSEERLRRFFVAEGPHYRIRKEVRDLVLFASHSALKDPPFIRLDLVTCRNLMIYLEREVQRQLCALFAYGLRPGGYLFLGSAETVDTLPEVFRPVDREARVYQVRPGAERPMLLLPHLPPQHRPPAPPRPPNRAPAERTAGASHAAALEEAAPPSALVDARARVLHLSPTAGRFLLPSAGPFSPELPALVRPELRVDLQSGLTRAFDRAEASLSLPVVVELDGAPRRVLLHVAPLPRDEHAPARALVSFLDTGPAEALDAVESSAKGARADTARRLQEEVRIAQEGLGRARSDHEAAVQELRAANEELQSMNEEYRSTSEELETSKEELQSINEELRTVNAELKQKLDSISSAHSDLQNLIASTDVGTLFLDPELRIRMFTPTVAEIFNITEPDLGRRITHFTHHLVYDAIEPDAQRVLRTLEPLEREVAAREGRWLMVRMRPYRTIEDRIEGVVVSFVDVTPQRLAADRLQESEERYRTLFESMDEGFLLAEIVHDAEGRPHDVYYLEANPAATAMLGTSLAGRRLHEAAPELEADWWEIPARVAGSGTPAREELYAAALGEWFELHISRICIDDGPIRIAILFQNISKRRRGEERLREAQELLTMATDAARLGWGAWDPEGGEATWDTRARAMLGLGEHDTRTSDWLDRLHPEDRGEVEAQFRRSLREGTPFDIEYRVVLPGGDVRRIHGAGTFQLDPSGRARRGAGIVRDVTARRRAEDSQQLLIQELNHRVKNMLAVVQSIAHQTRRSTESADAFFAAFEHRVQALGLAHSLLTQRTWQGADLGDLVRSTISALSGPGVERVRTEGSPVELSPNATITFAMALHELATNAIKYGALSAPQGSVEVSWRLLKGEDGAGGRFFFDWREQDGPPVARPRRKGFGSRMLERGIARELDGEVVIDYASGGVFCSMSFPTHDHFRPA